MRLFNTYAVGGNQIELENATFRTVRVTHKLSTEELEKVALLVEGESTTVTDLIILCVGHKE